MLDVGFSEILLTSAIALIVLGPERLPKVARQVGTWMGRARAMARQLTEQLEREVTADELMKAATAIKPPKSPAAAAAPPQPAPAQQPSAAVLADPVPFDTSAHAPPPPDPAVYAPNPAVTPHGADWHPAPIEPPRRHE